MDQKHFKQRLLDELYAPYKNCMKCPLGGMGRRSVVFGDGNPDATLMFIGEGPGEREDELNKPFVGRSGQLLNRTLTALGTSREEVYITNVVKCRPPNNRRPLPIESTTCKNLLLLNQIKIIRPKLLVTLGSCALEALIERSVSITKMRGTLIPYQDTHIMPTFHPAYILRNQKEINSFILDLRNAIEYAHAHSK